jgi:hypothetical protein
MFEDKLKEAVQLALGLAGVQIIADPYRFRSGGFKYQIDLAVKVTGLMAVVEIKSFLSLSFLEDFYAAIGQYITYRYALQLAQIHADLYLAVPSNVHAKHFAKPLIKGILEMHHVKLIVFDPEDNQSIQWIN